MLGSSSIAHYRRAVEFVVHQHSHHKHLFNLRNLKLGCGCGQSDLCLDNLIMLCSLFSWGFEGFSLGGLFCLGFWGFFLFHFVLGFVCLI